MQTTCEAGSVKGGETVIAVSSPAPCPDANLLKPAPLSLTHTSLTLHSLTLTSLTLTHSLTHSLTLSSCRSPVRRAQ
jgi:hypothetical protein